MGIKSELQDREEILLNIHSSLTSNLIRYFVFAMIIGALVITGIRFLPSEQIRIPVAGVIVFLFVWGMWELKRRTTTYYVTNKRVIIEHTLLGRQTQSAMYPMIADVRLVQGIMQRILHQGNIYLNMRGGREREVVLYNVFKPKKVKRIIEKEWSQHMEGMRST